MKKALGLALIPLLCVACSSKSFEDETIYQVEIEEYILEAPEDNSDIERLKNELSEDCDWIRYQDEMYDFNFEYPCDWGIRRVDNSGLFLKKRSFGPTDSTITLSITINDYENSPEVLDAGGDSPWIGKTQEQLEELSENYGEEVRELGLSYSPNAGITITIMTMDGYNLITFNMFPVNERVFNHMSESIIGAIENGEYEDEEVILRLEIFDRLIESINQP